MANSYSSNLRLILQTTGENSGTWGNYTNTNVGTLLEQAITGVGAIAVSGSSNYTLSATNGASDESRNAILNVTGTLTAAINIICPTVSKVYIIKNGTTGGYAVTLKTASGTGISVPNGSTMLLYCDGTNVVEGITSIGTYVGNLALAGNLSYTGTLTGSTGVINIGSGQIYKDASGNVGIGTSSPPSKLSVNGDIFLGYGQAIKSAIESTPAYNTIIQNYYDSNGNDTLLLKPAGASGGGQIIFASRTGTERMRIDASGNLLVGYTTSNGSYKLQVNSQIFATSSTIATSDMRYKEGVAPLTNAIDLVNKLNPVSFKWKEHPVHNFDTTSKTTGFLAQEVQSALEGTEFVDAIVKSNTCTLEAAEYETIVISPAVEEVKDEEGNIITEAVAEVTEQKLIKEAVTEEFLGIAEGNLISILTKAIQELSAEVNELKKQLGK